MEVPLFLPFLIFSTISGTLDTEFANSAFMDGAKKYEIYWNVNKEAKTVSFAVKVQTLGWVGFGISGGTGNMIGSDVIMGWMKDGKGYLQDRYASARSLPEIDQQQDYSLDGASEEDGYTILKFTRSYDTCDDNFDNKIGIGTTRVLYAYHTDDPTSDTHIAKHIHKGSRSLLLLNVHSKKPTIPNDLQHFDVLHNLTIPSDSDTSYMCIPFVFPQMATKHHIIEVAPVVTPGNEGYVHHIVVYSCKNTFNESHLATVGPCYDPNMPPDITDCAGLSTVAAWGIGGGPFYYPEHVGFAIGAGFGPRYVVMEVHYDNPDMTSGVFDHSGLRFYYTAQTRTYDAGVIWAGWAPMTAMIIPPQQEEWISVGYCGSECTREGFKDSSLPDGGINIFAILLHTHLQGVRIWTRHLRNGTELTEVARDDDYDFNFQEFQVLPQEIHIKPGDDIIQMCHYQSKDKTHEVLGGLGTKEEMCMSFIIYYPRVELTRCFSVNDVRNDLYARMNIGDPHNITWTPETVETYKELLDNSTDLTVLCSDGQSEPLPGVSSMVKPRVTTPLITDIEPCIVHIQGSTAISYVLITDIHYLLIGAAFLLASLSHPEI